MKARKETVVPKISYGWKQLIISILSQAKAQDGDLALSSRQVSQIISKGLLALSVVSLWWWNWQLLFASAIAVSLMWLTYKVPSKQWRKLWQTGIGFVNGRNSKLVFAVGSGSLGGLVTYMMSAIWVDTENHWLATGSILQGLATVAVLIMVGWQVSRKSDRNSVKFDRYLQDLTAAESLKRLIAIRQLTNLVRKKVLDREQKLQLIEYFHFMLSGSQESTIQEALLDGLDVLGFSEFHISQSHDGSTPIRLKHLVRENVS